MLFTGGKLVMAEAMVGLKRTHRCTEVSAANVGEKKKSWLAYICGFEGQKRPFADCI